MDTDNLDKIISNYIEDIPTAYGAEHDELFKWRAVKHFQDNWNPNAEDFVEMLKEATSETSIFINNSIVQPLNGLIAVAEKDSEVVKDVFRKLDESNSKSINERQDVVEECLKVLNDKVKEYFGDSWKYKQEKRTIIFYLTVLHPDDNYFYKSTEAMHMANCLGYADLSNGANFKLESYYRMCDQIREHIKENKELLEVHNSYLTNQCYEDKDLHILVFNIIRSADAYGYYQKSSIEYKRKKPISKKQQKEIEDMAEKEKAENENIILRTELADINDILSNLDEIMVKDLEIIHKTFGKGRIIEQVENSIIVRFENDIEKKFIIPLAFTKGYIKSTDNSILEACMELEKLEIKKTELERKIKLNEDKIELIKKRYEQN